MKKIVLIFVLTSIITTLGGCNTDDILTAENRNSLNSENFWLNQADAESGIFSVYSALQFGGVLGTAAITPLSLATETSRVGNVNRSDINIQFDDGLVISTNREVERMWRDLYQIVFRANQVLENVPGIEMDETVKKEILGEAYFLRGLAMFWVADTFNEGRVPYPLKAASSLEEARLELATREFVYNQIFEDLLQAQTNLADRLSWTDRNQEGRATWGAVTSILGKIYLYEENFARASEELLKVINSGQYSLTPNIGDNFTEAGEFNDESIFEVQFLVNIPDDDGNFGNGEGSQPDESSLRQVSWQRQGGFGAIFTTHFISSIYRNEVIDPNLPINQEEVLFHGEGYDPRDPEEERNMFIESVPRTYSHRMEASVAYEDDGTLYQTNTTVDVFTRVFSRTQIKKFFDWEQPTTPRSSGINERVIRLADVYLMYAEAILRQQGDGAIPEALTYINQVRQRSGLITLEKLFEGVTAPPIFRNTFQLRAEDVTDAEIAEFAEKALNNALTASDIPLFLKIHPDFQDDFDAVTIVAPETTIEEAQARWFLEDIDSEYRELDPLFFIAPQALTATNIVRHLFDKERPAEFAWEGRGITWGDLRRRPSDLIDDGVARIKQLGDVSYVPVTLSIQNFELDPQFRENSIQDFENAKVNFNEDDFFLPIPAEEIIQNPQLGN